MLILSEHTVTDEVRLEYSPFFDSILEDLKQSERRKINRDKKKYMFCVAAMSNVKKTRKLYKEGKYKQAEKYYNQLVKQIFGKDLMEFVPDKSKIVNARVVNLR